MPGRVVWTQEQDEILRYLREDRQQKKWSSIAKIMVSEFHIRKRSGKQCRQRYSNHLAATINRSSWTPEQDNQVILLHQQFGNKWSLIAQKIPGRTENCVKNHFYSKLRKAVRRLNRWSSDNSKKKESMLEGGLLSKIVSVSEIRFMPNSKKNDQWVHFSLDIIKRLYNIEKSFTKSEESEIDEEWLAQLTNLQTDIIYFAQNYRKPRRKCFRNMHLNHFQRAQNYKQNFDIQTEQNIRHQPVQDVQLRSSSHSKKEELIFCLKGQQCQYQQIPKNSVKSQKSQKIDQKKEKKEKKVEPLLIESMENHNEDQAQKNARTYKLGGAFDSNQQFLGINLPGTFESFCELERQMNWRDSRSKMLRFTGVQESQSCLFNEDSNYSI